MNRTIRIKHLINGIHLKPLVVILSFLSLSSCITYNQEDFEVELVLESYLIAGRSLSDVRVSQTSPVFEKYSFEELAINDASVIIREVSTTGEAIRNFDFQLKEPGLYEVINKDYKVQEQKTYQLIVESTLGSATASTTVPKQFLSNPSQNNEVVYQGAEQFEVEVTPTSTTERQTSFIFSVLAQSPSLDALTPFYASILEDDEETELEDLTLVSSPIINEANYEPIKDGQYILIRLPWISVAFFGPNKVVANSLDDNLNDFIRSQSVQLGGGALAPGEIQNIINTIEGGIGIFGSITTDTTDVVIIAPEIPFNKGD